MNLLSSLFSQLAHRMRELALVPHTAGEMPGEDGKTESEREDVLHEVEAIIDPDQFTPNFHRREFDSKDGAVMPDHVKVNVIELAKQLQIIRDFIGKPIHINSGYRSPEHNRRIGGARNSMHVQGKAADITIRGLSPDDVYELLIQLIAYGMLRDGGLGKYNSFTHYDIGTPRRWKG